MALHDVRDVPENRIRPPDPTAVTEFPYSEEFRRRIVHLLRGTEGLPRYGEFVQDHLGGPASRLMQFVRYLVPEIEYRCGNLKAMRVLDFGCGTGASTVALARRFKEVIAFDVDEESMEVCRMRLAEHGLESRVALYCAPSLRDVRDQIGPVDLVLMCGVIEHLPLTETGLRREVVQTLFGVLNAPGYLYVYDTPNRLWPVDFHTTGLWWIPWTRPGSPRALARAVRRGRWREYPKVDPGTRGLEQSGAWGATYWEILDYMKGQDYRCLNTVRGNNKHIDYLGGARKFRLARYPFDFFVGLFARPLRIPITAFYPFLDNLVILKPARNSSPYRSGALPVRAG